MVLKDYLYHAFQAFKWAKIIDLGIWREPSNLLKWDMEVVNFPGSEGYDCKCPWVYKGRKDGMIAANLFIYVDDWRLIGPT